MKTKLQRRWVPILTALAMLTSCSKGSRDAPGGEGAKQAESKGGKQEKPAGKPARVTKGQVYRAIDDKQVIKVVSSDELEVREKDMNLLCKFSTEEGKLRVVADVLGTKQVVYYTITEDGLREDDDGTILYRPDRYEVVMRDVLAKRKQEALNNQLLEAAWRSDASNALFALEGGAQVAITNTSHDTPLHLAAERGMTNLVELLLVKGADKNARLLDPPDHVRSGMTPLHLAAWLPFASSGFQRSGQDRTVSILLKAGADANPRDDAGHTPLSLAFEAENDGAVKLLIAAGADRTPGLAYAKRRIRDGWPDRRGALRTDEEEKLFKEGRIETRVIKTVTSYDFEWEKFVDWQLVLTDVGVKVIYKDGHAWGPYLFSEFGLRWGQEPESKDFEAEGRYPKRYVVDFGLGGGDLNPAFKAAGERDSFFKALTEAREEWRKKYGRIPGVP